MHDTARKHLPAAALATALCGALPAAADGPAVATTIQPVHSLIAGVTAGVTEPYQLVRGGQSPHGYSLSPSDSRALHGADLVFAAGESVEGFLVRAAGSLDEDTRIVWLEEMDDVVLHEARAGGAWEPHDHDHDHDHDDDSEHGHADDHDHDHGDIDSHLWLDPQNAIVLTERAADKLAALDPDNAERYRANAEEQVTRLEALVAELDGTLEAARERPYLVFHDAYQYFEQRFDLAAAGSVTIDPERPPGARRINELQQRIATDDIACVFAEPQFEPRVIETITEKTEVAVGQLDPLGAEIEPGPDAYFTLLRNLAADLEACLAD